MGTSLTGVSIASCSLQLINLIVYSRLKTNVLKVRVHTSYNNIGTTSEF